MIARDYIRKGNLVYIPSGVRLVIHDVDEHGTRYASEWTDTTKPANCIIMADGIKDVWCEILYCGKLWHVKISDAYAIEYDNNTNIKKENNNVSNSR